MHAPAASRPGYRSFFNPETPGSPEPIRMFDYKVERGKTAKLMFFEEFPTAWTAC